ncbi:unnamed protein product [Diamesa serratosioi]
MQISINCSEAVSIDGLKDRIRNLFTKRNAPDIIETTISPLLANKIIQESNNKTLIHSEVNILMVSLGQLEISSPEKIMAYINEDNGCKKLKHYLGIYKKNHKNVANSNLYVRLFKGIEKFYTLFCGKDDQHYRRVISSCEESLRSLHEQFIDCEGKLDWYEKVNSSIVCSDAQSILECYHTVIITKCDSDVARRIVHLFEYVLNALLMPSCDFVSIINSKNEPLIHDDGFQEAIRSFDDIKCSSSLISANYYTVLIALILGKYMVNK